MMPLPRTAFRIATLIALLSSPFAASMASQDLLSVYEQARQTDPQITAAEATYQSEVEGVAIARGGLLPQISASASLTSSKGKYEGASGNSIDYYENGDKANIFLEQALFRKDLWEELNRAELVTARAEVELSAARQDLIVRVSEAYFNVLAARDNLAFSGAEKGALASQLRQADKQYEVGLGAVTDVKETRAQLDVATAQEIRARNELSVAMQRLQIIAGITSSDLQPLLGSMPLERPNPNNIDHWEETAKNNNLALKASELQLAIAEKGVDVSTAQRLPTLSLSGQIGRDNTENFKLGDELDTRSQIALNLQVPIYSGGRTSATIRRAQSQVGLADSQRLLQQRLTLSEAREAFLNQVFSVSHAMSLKQALSSTRAAYEATKAGYNVGTRTAVEVLFSLRETYRAQRDYSRSRYDYALNWLRLKRSAGTLSDDDLKLMSTWF